MLNPFEREYFFAILF